MWISIILALCPYDNGAGSIWELRRGRGKIRGCAWMYMTTSTVCAKRTADIPMRDIPRKVGKMRALWNHLVIFVDKYYFLQYDTFTERTRGFASWKLGGQERCLPRSVQNWGAAAPLSASLPAASARVNPLKWLSMVLSHRGGHFIIPNVNTASVCSCWRWQIALRMLWQCLRSGRWTNTSPI